MYRPRVRDEIEACPGISREEFGRQHVTLEPVASAARQHDVARHVGPTVRQRMHVIERGVIEIERRRAIDAAAAAVAHGGPLDRSLLVSGWYVLAPTTGAREAGE